MALSGGFTPTPPESEMQKELYGTPGLDLVRADPSKYLVQNLPGVQYDAQGNIIGQGGVFNQPTMANVRVASNYTDAPRYFAEGGFAKSRQNIMQALGPQQLLGLAGFFKPGYKGDFKNKSMAGGFLQRMQERKAAQVAAAQVAAAQAAANAPGQRNKFFSANPENYMAAAPAPQQSGIAALAQGGYPRRTGQISGPGTEKSDSIPAMLSDGEFVMTAKAVRGLGKGSRLEGAKRMYALMHQLETNASRG